MAIQFQYTLGYWNNNVSTIERRKPTINNKLQRWLLEGIRQSKHSKIHHQDSWWKVMCLTGVDYFSTLGYQPGIAFLAAGMLSPLATLILVLLTLFGALPVYTAVAKESPHGQGSISMLERLLPGWKGKTLVLVLLGFAATDFIITITLSAADATAHIIENPVVDTFMPAILQDRLGITLFLLAILGGIFLAGFREAIGLSVALVASYLILNAVAVSVGLQHLIAQPQLIQNWHGNLLGTYKSFWSMLGMSLILFPKLALGLSGFETGVAVMPLVKGNGQDETKDLEERIKNTRKLLITAAIIMSVFLLSSSLCTSLLIPPEAFADGGAANGRAISYLAHQFLGHGFGSIYDLSSILILWFAGASAMAGLLNLVPRYLPRYGMAPDWASAIRPLVLFFISVAFVVTVIFKADVDAQAGAYATGVLVLITSAALAVTLNVWKTTFIKRWIFLIISGVFIYTSIINMIERPEGLHIASFFIGTILCLSLLSRAFRALELRIQTVEFDALAKEFVSESLQKTGDVTLLAHRPGGIDYKEKEDEARKIHKLTLEEADFIFLEVAVSDASDFSYECLQVTGHRASGHRVLRCTSPAIPNAIAAILLQLRDETKTIPHAYFGWTEGHPLAYVFKYIFLGEGETAPVAREILREKERDPERRPRIHVG